MGRVWVASWSVFTEMFDPDGGIDLCFKDHSTLGLIDPMHDHMVLHPHLFIEGSFGRLMNTPKALCG